MDEALDTQSLSPSGTVLSVGSAFNVSLLLPLMASFMPPAQQHQGSGSISVRFAVDGKAVACAPRVKLRFAGRTLLTERTDRGFAVPAVFIAGGSEQTSDADVDVTVSCGKYTLEFRQLKAGWVRPGRWEAGIAYPPYAVERFRRTGALEHGEWLSYLVSDCDDCEPGVETWISHPGAPQTVTKRLRRQQAGASGERARDIAYALAVFGVDYQPNRDFLIGLLNSCLSRPKGSSEDDVCDYVLPDYLTSLYWRGDDGLLETLLASADNPSYVVSQIGDFYADLLDRRTAAAVQRIRMLAPAKQASICGLAGKIDFSIDAPKFKRVADQLRASGGATAEGCLEEAQRGAGRAAE
jgi:hypothetical protein